MAEASRTAKNRRTFLLTGAAACGAVALWKFSGPHFASAATLPPTVTLVEFDASGKPTGKVVVKTVIKTDAEWRHQLSLISYDVTRHEGTEPAFSGDTYNLHERGIFRCICCDTALFSSETKFDSGTGWPSFWQPIAKENVAETSDSSFGMARTAVSCRRCAAHLGHVFDDGPQPTGLRYCMNSAALHFAKNV